MNKYWIKLMYLTLSGLKYISPKKSSELNKIKKPILTTSSFKAKTHQIFLSLLIYKTHLASFLQLASCILRFGSSQGFLQIAGIFSTYWVCQGLLPTYLGMCCFWAQAQAKHKQSTSKVTDIDYYCFTRLPAKQTSLV